MADIWDSAEQESLVEALLGTFRNKRVQRRRPTWLLVDVQKGEFAANTWKAWRGRKIPKSADTRVLLFTQYMWFVWSRMEFRVWAAHLRSNFPSMMHQDFVLSLRLLEFVKAHGLLDAYAQGKLEQVEGMPKLTHLLKEDRKQRMASWKTKYEAILSRALLESGNRERAYLCRHCGLHRLAQGVFGNAQYGPELSHQLVSADDSTAVLLAQSQLGEFVVGESLGHGESGGLRLSSFQDVYRSAWWLFQNQVLTESKEAIAIDWEKRKLIDEETNPDSPPRLAESVHKSLMRIRRVVGIHRPAGRPNRWNNIEPGARTVACRHSAT